ncbi:MAG: hypothetical protein R3D67_13735 [Hyphomicrobiaceae bacterium]
MQPEPIENTSMIELALQDLQMEREACVGRLRQVLEQSQHADEAQGYLRRIDNINAALVRLASARLRN